MIKTMKVEVDQELDLKGEVCPYTFVKTKLALEMMEMDQVLRVIVDHLPAVENVPRSVTNEGHEVLNVGQVNDTDWEIFIRKAG
ncbi:MAG: sulfurtransferase TusA family protein [Anaerolineae bacterium]